MTALKLRLLALLLLALPCGVAGAQPQDSDNIKRELHRSNVDALDATGWQLAASTKGNFSVRLPVPFTDGTIRSTEPELDLVIQLITGASGDGIRFSVTEMTATGKNAKDPDIGVMPADLASKRGSQVSELVRDTKDGVDKITFLISNPRSSAYMQIVKTRGSLYQCVLEFPESQRAKAMVQKDEFFRSFKIKD